MIKKEASIGKKIYIEIISPENLVFEGEVEAISSVNNKGVFDVLPLHENFISVVKDKVVIHNQIGKEKREIVLKSGIVKVYNNKVHFFIGFENLETDIGMLT